MVQFFSSRRSRYLAGAAAIALLATVSDGSAQTPTPEASEPITGAAAAAGAPKDVGIEQVVVTSRKRTEVLREVPVAVDVVTHKEITERGIKSLADVATITPGVTFDQGISANDSRPAIRGFYTERGRPSVAILIDGYDTTTESVISAGGGAQVNLNLLDLDRVEVVKGPQSALYGRNAFGGAINYITAKPTNTPHGEISAEVGNHGDYKVFGTFSQALGDKVSYRASLETDGMDGFYRNTTTGKKLGGHDTQGGSLDILLKPTDDVTIRIYTELDHSKYGQAAAVNLASNAMLHNYSLKSSSALTVPQVVGTIGANPSEVAYSGNYPGSRTTTLRNYVTADVDLDWANFSSRTGFASVHNRTTQDTDYGNAANPAATFSFVNELQDYTYDTTQVSQEFRLTSPDESKLKWLAGIYGFYEDTTLDDATQYYLDKASAIFPHGRLSPTASQFLNPTTTTRRKTYHASAYGSVGYEVLPKLNATAELRIAYEGVDASLPSASRTAISEYNGGVTYGLNGQPLGVSTLYGQTVSRYVNPKFALDYALTPTQNIYGAISRGTKPAGLSLLNISGGGFNGQKYKQEKVWEYEIGDKLSFWNNRIQINADAYFNDYHDQQVSYNVITGNSQTVGVTNAGSVYAFGQELEITARPIPPLTLNVGYSHVNEYFKDYQSQVASDLEYIGGNFDNKKVSNVPPHQLTMNARYEMAVTENLNGFIQASGLYESARYGNDYNTFKLGAFFEPRFLVGVENDKYSVLFFMNNPFNDKTIRSTISYFDLHRNLTPTALAYLPDPMTFGVRMSYKF